MLFVAFPSALPHPIDRRDLIIPAARSSLLQTMSWTDVIHRALSTDGTDMLTGDASLIDVFDASTWINDDGTSSDSSNSSTSPPLAVPLIAPHTPSYVEHTYTTMLPPPSVASLSSSSSIASPHLSYPLTPTALLSSSVASSLSPVIHNTAGPGGPLTRTTAPRRRPADGDIKVGARACAVCHSHKVSFTFIFCLMVIRLLIMCTICDALDSV